MGSDSQSGRRNISYRTIAQREELTVSAIKLRLFRVRPCLRASVGKAIGMPARNAVVTQPPQARAAA